MMTEFIDVPPTNSARETRKPCPILSVPREDPAVLLSEGLVGHIVMGVAFKTIYYVCQDAKDGILFLVVLEPGPKCTGKAGDFLAPAWGWSFVDLGPLYVTRQEDQ